MSVKEELWSRLTWNKAKRVTHCVHGGEVWEVTRKTGQRVEDILDFSVNINPLGPSPCAVEAIKQSFGLLTSYPDSGCVTLREEIARSFDGLGKSNVVVGNGSTELVYLFADVFLKRGDLAVVAAPTFGEYENAVRRAGGEPRFVCLSHDFQVKADAFVRVMRDAKVVFLCNPNSPTSLLIPHVDLVKIVEAALDLDVLVLLDESYIEFVNDEESHSLVGRISEFQNLLVLRTFTKFYGLTGLRIGFGVGCDEIVEVLANARMPWNVNSLAQVAAVAALVDKEHAQKTRQVVRMEREFLLRELAGLRVFRVFPADANYIFLDVRRSGFTAALLKEKMLQYGVLIRDCSSFQGLDAFYVRVAVRTRGENERLLAAFHEVLGSGV